jgi:hypothetical protein
MAIDGMYRLILNYPFGRMKITLDLLTEGTVLTGVISGGIGPAELLEGRVDGNELSWRVMRTHFPFSCVARIDGASIKGEADFGEIFGKAWMRGGRADPETGKSCIDDEAALPWKDMGLPRYEFASVEWVKAMGEWLRARFEGHKPDFDFTWSTELSDPPKHLLRHAGDTTIGFHFTVKNGELNFGDGPLRGVHDIDFGGKPIPYAATAARMRMHTDEMIEMMRQTLGKKLPTGPLLPPLATDPEIILRHNRLNDFIAGPENIIRQDFYSQRTL